DLPRPFRVPAIWLVAPAGVVTSVFLMLSLPPDTWLRLSLWVGIGLVIYFSYGRTHSPIAQTSLYKRTTLHSTPPRCNRGLPRLRIIICASRASPTCDGERSEFKRQFEFRVRGLSTNLSLTAFAGAAPHPNPLPAKSGEREKGSRPEPDFIQ